MSKLQKILIGAAGASALMLSASPAMAKRGYDNDRYERQGQYERGDRYDRSDRYERGDRYDRANRHDNRNSRYSDNRYQLNRRRAVRKCKRAIRRHLGHAGRVEFRNIGDVRAARFGTEVVGRLVLQTNRANDRGRFRCTVNGYGRPSLSFRGLWNGR